MIKRLLRLKKRPIAVDNVESLLTAFAARKGPRRSDAYTLRFEVHHSDAGGHGGSFVVKNVRPNNPDLFEKSRKEIFRAAS